MAVEGLAALELRGSTTDERRASLLEILAVEVGEGTVFLLRRQIIESRIVQHRLKYLLVAHLR